MSNFLSLREISKSYGAHKVLHPVNLDIREGEFFFLLGPSGCGKTTLLRILAGLLEPDSGSVSLKGTDITRLPAHKRDINTVFQNYALFPHMNVFENIAFGLRMKKASDSEIRERVTSVLKLVDLKGFETRRTNQMSGGQMQRVALARALVNRPSVLLLDEPLGALDVKLRKQMQLELRHIQKQLGTTFVCVTHDQEEALTLSDRIAIMREGSFEQIGDSDTLYNHPDSFYVCDFLGECNFLKNLPQQSSRNRITLSVGGETITAPGKSGLSATDKVTIGIRPERLQLVKKAASAEIQKDLSQTNMLEGVVSEVIFTGGFYTVVCNSGEHELRVQVPNNAQRPRFVSGDEVKFFWDIEDTIVLNTAEGEV